MSQTEHNTPENETQAAKAEYAGQAAEQETEVSRKEQDKAAVANTGGAAEENTGKSMSESKNIPQTAAPVVIKESSGKGLAAGALVLALLGLGASGFLFVQGQNVLKTQELAFAQKIDKAALGESENAALLKDNINRQTLIQTELERLGSGQKANAEQIAMSRKAYQELLKGRADWLVDEAETMLNLASQQLLLSGNVPGAISVLEHINNRLSRFDQAGLLPIKQAVSHDLSALKSRPYVDISGTALRIDRLETAVSGLPLIVDGTLKPGAEEKVATDASLSWWENAWEKSLGALKGLVEVRKLDSNDAMLLAPEQIYFVRENLRLRLLDARTALMQRNGEVYQSDLNNVEAAVRQYFDNKSPATQSWLKELAELKTLDVRMVSDDVLKSSLAAVRAYQDDVRTQVAGVAVEEPEAQAASAAVEPAQAAASAPAVMPEAPALPSEQSATPPEASASAPEQEGKQKPQTAPATNKAKGEAA
ncbi:uroporphyrinogen-III C-methyltransferase [Neisseria animalis]